MHILKKHITGEIPRGTTFYEVYGISDKMKVRELIGKALKYGTVKDLGDGWLEIRYILSSDKPPVIVVTNNGKIWAAYPKVR